MSDLNKPNSSKENDAFNSGKHCAKPDCRMLDFLPLVCPHCHLAFCSSHAHVFSHDCSLPEVLRSTPREPGSKSAGPTCDPVRTLINDHTQPPAATVKEDRNAKAKEILAARFPAVSQRERQPARPAKELSPALKLILLKRRAISGNPQKKDSAVPPDCRWYGLLGCAVAPGDSQNLAWTEQRALASEPKAVWFDKKMVVGKIFDLVVTTFKPELLSHSYSCSTSDLQLFTIRSGNHLHLITDQCSEAWGDVVKEGEEVWLTGRNIKLS